MGFKFAIGNTALNVIRNLSKQDFRYGYNRPVDTFPINTWSHSVTIRNRRLSGIINQAVMIADNPLSAQSLIVKDSGIFTPQAVNVLVRDQQPISSGAGFKEKNHSYVKVFLTGNNRTNGETSYLDIFFTPFEVDYQVNSDMKSLGIIGADLETYHYGGSEDTLVFDISWMGLKNSPQGSALEKAQRMVRLTKGEGWFKNSPPVIQLKWGRGDDTPFQNMFFIVEKAPYKPRQFTPNQSSTKDLDGSSLRLGSPHIISNDFHPQYIIQSVTLKRVR